MRTCRRLVLALALLLGARAAGAQTLSPRLQEKLREFSTRAPSSLTEADWQEFDGVMISISREFLDSGLSPSERARLAGVPISVVELEGAPPAWVDGSAIRLSSDALTDVMLLGMYLGHDVYVAMGSEFPLGSPLVTRPFAASAILPLLASLHELSLAGTPVELIKCPSTFALCAEPQAAAIFGGTLGFLIAHEMSHLLLGHRPAGRDPRPLAEELAADAKAWSILQRAAPGITDDTESLDFRVRVGIEAGPLLLLRWILDGQPSDSAPADAVYDRISALNDRLSEGVAYEVGAVVDEEPVVDRLRTFEIAWVELPDELYVDGVRVQPQEVAGKTLQVVGRVRVLARKGTAFAFSTLPAVGGRQPERLQLDYKPLVTELPSSSELSEWRRQGEWFKVLLTTATPQLTPRPGAPARALFEAMDRLGVAQLIDPTLAGPSARDRALPQFWRKRAEPLGRWRPSAP